MTPSTFAGLPKWVRRVEFCPNPGNISLWIEESKKLNCYHHLSSDDPKMQEKVYHCLPSSFLNETVEFCGRNVPVEAGTFCVLSMYSFILFLEYWDECQVNKFCFHLQENVPYIVMKFHKMWLLIRTTAPNSHRGVQKRSFSQKMHIIVRCTQ